MGDAPGEGAGVEWIDLGRPASAPDDAGTPAVRPNWRVAAAVVGVLIAMLVAYGLGRSGGPAPEIAALPEVSTPVPTAPPAPTATPAPTPTVPPLTDLLGEGQVIEELALGDGTRAVLWCREAVPGTRIEPTLALLHFHPTVRQGDQLISYEELVRPWVPTGASWRGQIDTEGFGVDAAAAEIEEPEFLDGTEPEGTPGDGTRCRACTPERADLADAGIVLFGNCEHGVPFRAGISYVVATPTVPGQSPLAVLVDCGITSISFDGERFRIDAEVPLVRGLTDARFRLPSVMLEHRDGRFWADDLGLLDWACDVEGSSHLGDRHLLRTDREPRLSYETVDSALGPIGVHGPVVVGLDRDQCSQLTRAWWGSTAEERESGRPIARLVELDPPDDVTDWVYTCQSD